MIETIFTVSLVIGITSVSLIALTLLGIALNKIH